MSRPYAVALTGGIGSGKSAVADMFARHGAALIDTDQIAHQLTSSSGTALPEIVKAFGVTSLAEDGSLDRPAMRARVFADAAARQRLEGILHPRIRSEVARRLSEIQVPYAMIVVPLLVETEGYEAIADRVLVVDCDEATQVSRVMQRNGFSESMVRAIMASQARRQARLARADDVIVNEAGLAELAVQVAQLHLDYLKRARQYGACGEAHCVHGDAAAQ